MVDGIKCEKGKIRWMDCFKCSTNCLPLDIRMDLMETSMKEIIPSNAHGVTSLVSNNCIGRTFLSKTTEHFKEKALLLLNLDDKLSQIHETRKNNNMAEITIYVPVSTDSEIVLREGPFLHPEHTFLMARLDFVDIYAKTLYEKKSTKEKDIIWLPKDSHYEQAVVEFWMARFFFDLKIFSILYHVRAKYDVSDDIIHKLESRLKELRILYKLNKNYMNAIDQINLIFPNDRLARALYLSFEETRKFIPADDMDDENRKIISRQRQEIATKSYIRHMNDYENNIADAFDEHQTLIIETIKNRCLYLDKCIRTNTFPDVESEKKRIREIYKYDIQEVERKICRGCIFRKQCNDTNPSKTTSKQSTTNISIKLNTPKA